MADPALGNDVQDGDHACKENVGQENEETQLDVAYLANTHDLLLDQRVVPKRMGADVHT